MEGSFSELRPYGVLGKSHQIVVGGIMLVVEIVSPASRREEGAQRTMRAEERVEINRPLQEVFSYVANPKNIPEW